MSEPDGINIAEEVARLTAVADRQLRATYAKLTPWQKTQVARHPERPHLKDYIAGFVDDFMPLAGDRAFADDQAIIGGFGRIAGRRVVVIGHEKGDDTATRIKHNFGMAKPEGYRKADRLMNMADRFKLPIITFVDTMGAFAGKESEEHGISEAIAHCLETCFRIEVPLIALVIGEGGSGGAVAIAGADRVLMMEHSYYSVITPEGCAAILWRSGANAPEAANALKLTAQDLKELGVIDEIVAEPFGGAHRRKAEAIANAGDALERALDSLRGMDGQQLKAMRRDKFLAMGREPGIH
jgi:acetyl-CoA carboxylase carboxyl transferase subunit alpha